ncbi:small vasohibin-binding protein [Acipenser oxyrinchus oxyrinchus]|uniref:Small vasohibin-binding protein n=1 Tax=Acipenser oxyrinchus oxyrinchus TaxID=40147 RepID=A0AAD8CWQ5_ACIOX|nr:small vasohibin-binding protein [Acipenser oxyrinchus oxyrinchus]
MIHFCCLLHGEPLERRTRKQYQIRVVVMEPACRKDRQKQKETPNRGDNGKAKQKSAQQELKQRQRAEIYALNKVMTELEQQQFEAFCKQMQSRGSDVELQGFRGTLPVPEWKQKVLF